MLTTAPQAMNNDIRTESRLTPVVHCAVIGLFVLLTVILTWPLLLQMESSSPGDGYIYQHIFWWYKKALLSLQNPFITDYVFFPQGANLAFNAGVFSSFLLTLPVNLLWGIPQAINTAHIISFTLSGYFTFLLAYELCRHRGGALLAGLVYAYIPYHFNHFPSQLNLSDLQWLPLYLLLLKMSLERTGWPWPVWCGVTAVIVMLTDSMQVVIMVLLSLLVLLWYVGSGRLGRAAFIRLGVIAITALCLGSGYLWYVVKFIKESHDSLMVGLFDHGGANHFSGDLLGFITPQSNAPLLGKIFAAGGTHWRNILYLGYLPMLLAVYGGWQQRRTLWGRILVILVIVGVVLTLGATLHLNGQWQRADGSYLRLPFAYLSGLPLFSEVRTPYRFHIMTVLGVALLAGSGFSQICGRLRQPAVASMLLVGCSALLLVEYYPGQKQYEPLPPVPKIYREIGAQSGDFSVLQLPLSRWSALVRNGAGGPYLLQYYQLTHGKRIFGGLVARTSNQRLDFHDEVLDTVVSINALERFEIFDKQRLPALQEIEEVRTVARILRLRHADFASRNRLRYVVLHDHAARAGSLSRVFLEEFLGKTIVDEPQDGVAYVRL